MVPPIPADGNYTTWLSFLTDRADQFCGTDMTYSVTPSDLGKYLFNGMSTKPQADALESWIVADTGVGDYIMAKGGVVALVVIALIVLVACICFSFAVLEGYRKKIAKWFCCNKGWCMDRERVRFEDVPSGWKIIMIGGTIFFAAACLATSILLIIDTVQVLQANNTVFCDTWMTMRGHFFGVEDLSRGDVDGIAWDWKGTMAQLTELQDIQYKVTPGDDNPLLMMINDAYYDLQVGLNKSIDSTCQWVAGMNTSLQAVANLTNNLASADDAFTHKMWLGRVTMDKTIEYNQVLIDTVNNGYSNMTVMIAKYLGPDSALLSEGYGVATNAIQTIKDVNGAIAQLIDTFDTLGGLLNILLKLLVAISFIIAICSILCGVASVWLVFRLYWSFKHDNLPTKWTRKMLPMTYVSWMMLGGFSAFSCGLTFMLGSMGWDACEMAETSLLTEGNWNILGQTILHSVPNSSVDLWPILDTCVRADGDGDVASALGINSLLSTLEMSTKEASIDIDSLVDRVLDPPDKIVRAQLMQVGYTDSLSFIYRPDVMQEDDKNGYFNDTHYVRPETEQSGFGPWDLLCLAPVYGAPNSEVLTTCEQDLMFPVASMNGAIDAINERVVPVVRKGDTTFPTSFCSRIVARDGFPCGTDPDAKMISYDSYTNGDIDKWTSVVKKNSGGDSALWSKFKIAAQGIALNEGIAGLKLQQLIDVGPEVHTNCSFLALQDGCIYGDYLDAQHKIFKETSPWFVGNATDMIATVENFVADPVMTTMNGLVSDAKSALQSFNCQFIGTSLQYSTVDTLCSSMMPGCSMLGLLFGCHFFVCMLAAWGVWKNFHYVHDMFDCLDQEGEHHYYVESQTKNMDNKRAMDDEALKAIYGSQSLVTATTEHSTIAVSPQLSKLTTATSSSSMLSTRK